MLEDPHVQFSAEAGRHRLQLRGEIDLLAQPLLDEAYDRLVALGPSDVLIDLSEVTFLASNGLGFLARIHSHVDAGGHGVTLCRPDRSVQRALTVMGLDRFFAVTGPRTPDN